MAIPNRNHSNSDNRCTGVSLTSHHLSSLKGTLGNKFPESLIRIGYPRYCYYYRFRAELLNSFFISCHKDALVEKKRVWQFLVRVP